MCCKFPLRKHSYVTVKLYSIYTESEICTIYGQGIKSQGGTLENKGQMRHSSREGARRDCEDEVHGP